jgi:hypothetical protein
LSRAIKSAAKLVTVLAILCLAAATVFAASAGPTAPQPILPQQFAGWQLQGKPQVSKDATAADSANAALLKEYGFTDFESATYKSDDGRTPTPAVPSARTASICRPVWRGKR